MMKKSLMALVVAVLLASTLSGHDMFLKFTTYFIAPGSQVTMALINGTYDKSENAIGRDRMRDVRIVGPDDRVVYPEKTDWWEEDDTTWLRFEAGPPGTHVVGVSTAPRFIDLTAAEFNEYLEHDGVLDVLAARRRTGIADRAAREEYSKHVKAIIQVGERPSAAWKTRLGYPIEIVPLVNPYDLGVGDNCEVLVLRDGEPVANQLVYASYEGYHRHDDAGGHVEAVSTRTDESGVARFELSRAGEVVRPSHPHGGAPGRRGRLRVELGNVDLRDPIGMGFVQEQSWRNQERSQVAPDERQVKLRPSSNLSSSVVAARGVAVSGSNRPRTSGP